MDIWIYTTKCKQIIIIISLFWEFFTQALANGFSQKSVWQQVS